MSHSSELSALATPLCCRLLVVNSLSPPGPSWRSGTWSRSPGPTAAPPTRRRHSGTAGRCKPSQRTVATRGRCRQPHNPQTQTRRAGASPRPTESAALAAPTRGPGRRRRT
eukprot:scaffold2932_cov97-Isochrysis_galbana.AAC.2